MPWLWDPTAEKIELFCLVLFRVSGFFVTAPFWSHSRIPRRLKAAISLILAWLLAPLIVPGAAAGVHDLAGLAGLAIQEVLTGSMVGFAYAMLFYGVRSAGQAAGMQMGFAIVNVIDPHSHQSVSLLGEYKFILLTLVFLLLDGHHLVLQALCDSYQAVPIGGLTVSSLAGEKIMRLSAMVFVIAVKLAAPMIVTLLLTDVALGIVARTVPQMNIFIVGFPIKIGVGLAVLAASVPLLSAVFAKLLYQIQIQTSALIAVMAGA